MSRVVRYPTKLATSAGGLVYDDRPDGRWVVLIAHRNAAGQLQWTLPKGGLEDDEDLVDAAVREVREETGFDAEIEAKLGVVDYWFVWKPDRIRYHKFVHYYLMVLRGGDVARRDDEAEDVRWVRIDEALTLLAHPNERRLVHVALEASTGDERPGHAGGKVLTLVGTPVPGDEAPSAGAEPTTLRVQTDGGPTRRRIRRRRRTHPDAEGVEPAAGERDDRGVEQALEALEEASS